jgi:HPt (histidine-containing phosphotransfer) domain-containing protein
MIDDTRSVFDLAALDRQTSGDRELQLELVRMFLEDCPSHLAAIRAAVADGDGARIRSGAHTLKGAAAYLSAAFVADAAAHLETIGREGRLAEAVASLERLEAAVARLLPELRRAER